MNKFRGLSLNIIIPIIFVFVFGTLQSGVFLYEYQQAKDKLYLKSEQHIKGIAGELQMTLASAMMKLEKAQAQDIVSTMGLNENIETIVVIDNNHQIILSNHFREKYMFAKLNLALYQGVLLERAITQSEIIVMDYKETHELVAYAPLQIMSKGNSLNRKFNSAIFIRYSLASAYSELASDNLSRFIKSLMILLLATIVIMYFINQLLVMPLKKIMTLTTENLTDETELPFHFNGELGELQQCIAKFKNAMVNNIGDISKSEQRLSNAINATRDGVWDWDIENDKFFYSNRWKEILGYETEHIQDDVLEWEERIHPDDLFTVLQDTADHFAGKTPFFENIHRVKRSNGDYLWVLSRGQTVSWDNVGNPLRVIGTIIDISSYKKFSESIKYHKQFDEVTELPNRLHLTSHISQENTRLQNNGLHGAVIFIGCDQFKTVKILQGNDKGDELLYLIGRRLEDNKSGSDFIAHLQGGEFVILLPDLHVQREQAAEVALNFSKQLSLLLKEPFNISGEEVVLNYALGITLFPSKNIAADDLLRQAAVAMKTAEDNQFGNVSFFSKIIEEKIHRTHHLQNKIRYGLAHQEFSLFFQPRSDVKGNLVGAESLSRWYRGEEGWAQPKDFISVAEDCDLIYLLGDWVILNTFLSLKKWTNEGLPRYFKTLSLNISPKQLLQENFVTSIEKHLIETGIDPTLIEFEITETVLMTHTELVIRKLNALRQLGFRFSIDDFGTGYSSFSYLSILPVSALKIDQSFIVNLLDQHNQQVIVEAIINMGKLLNLDVIAEGVETKDQLNLLISMGCNQFQGYYIGQPLTNNHFQTRIKNEKLKFNNEET